MLNLLQVVGVGPELEHGGIAGADFTFGQRKFTCQKRRLRLAAFPLCHELVLQHFDLILGLLMGLQTSGQ